MSKEWIEIPLSIGDKIGQWALWSATKIAVALPGILIYSWKQVSKLSLHLATLSEAFYCNLIIPLDALPYGGMNGSKLIEVKSVQSNDFEVCTDILEVLEGKHGLLIGGSGDGKTTAAMFIAYSIGGRIRIYDADAAADEWQGLEVIGRCADFSAINEAMALDLEDLQERTIKRGKEGSNACNGLDTVTIAEEFPLLVGEVDLASEWLIKHGKRGRRVKKFILAIAQNDTAANFGIEGDKGVIDSFRIIRLGKKAQAHARKLKNWELEEWLKGDRSRLLADDIPVQLPPYREIQRVIQQNSLSCTQVLPPSPGEYPETTPETTETEAESDFQPAETSFPETSIGGEIGLLSEILGAIQGGKSDDWIAKNIVQLQQSIGYYKAKDKVKAIREMMQ